MRRLPGIEPRLALAQERMGRAEPRMRQSIRRRPRRGRPGRRDRTALGGLRPCRHGQPRKGNPDAAHRRLGDAGRPGPDHPPTAIVRCAKLRERIWIASSRQSAPPVLEWEPRQREVQPTAERQLAVDDEDLAVVSEQQAGESKASPPWCRRADLRDARPCTQERLQRSPSARGCQSHRRSRTRLPPHAPASRDGRGNRHPTASSPTQYISSRISRRAESIASIMAGKASRPSRR